MKQAGMAMVEALVASALLGLGLLSVSGLTSHALGTASQSRQQMHARLLAEEALDCMIVRRAFCPPSKAVLRASMTYTVLLERSDITPWLTQVHAEVQWGDVSGQHRQKSRFQTRVSTMPDWVGLSLP